MKVKKAWVAPKLEVQKFVANEYIASCWEVASVWNPDKSMLIQKDPTPSAEDDDQFFKGVAGEWWYSGGKLGSPFDNESLENGARWVVLEEINEENNDNYNVGPNHS